MAVAPRAAMPAFEGEITEGADAVSGVAAYSSACVLFTRSARARAATMSLDCRSTMFRP